MPNSWLTPSQRHFDADKLHCQPGNDHRDKIVDNPNWDGEFGRTRLFNGQRPTRFRLFGPARATPSIAVDTPESPAPRRFSKPERVNGKIAPAPVSTS
jgi:hypothetical protein